MCWVEMDWGAFVLLFLLFIAQCPHYFLRNVMCSNLYALLESLWELLRSLESLEKSFRVHFFFHVEVERS